MAVLNRSAIIVKVRQPFLDWLHAADPTSRKLSLRDLVPEPTIYSYQNVTWKRTFAKSWRSCVKRFSSNN